MGSKRPSGSILAPFWGDFGRVLEGFRPNFEWVWEKIEEESGRILKNWPCWGRFSNWTPALVRSASFIEAKRYFLQNRIFDEHAKQSSKNHPQTLPKSSKNQHQNTNNRQKSLQKCDFERRCPKIRPRSAPEAPENKKSGPRPVGLTAGSGLHQPGGPSFKELLFPLRGPGGKNSCEQARYCWSCCWCCCFCCCMYFIMYILECLCAMREKG